MGLNPHITLRTYIEASFLLDSKLFVNLNLIFLVVRSILVF